MLDAPRDLVWKCFTDPEHMKQWWGPKGVKIVKSEMDLRVGGTYHYGMQTPDGSVMWGKQVYREITPKDRLVFINSFSDENGGLTRHPMAPTWPIEMMSIFTFEDQPGNKTKFTVRWSPHNATRRGAQDLRRRPRQHEPGLERHDGAARSLSGENQSLSREITMNYVDGFVLPVQKKKLAAVPQHGEAVLEDLARAWRAGVL